MIATVSAAAAIWVASGILLVATELGGGERSERANARALFIAVTFFAVGIVVAVVVSAALTPATPTDLQLPTL